jgi:hypothetical protein
MLDAINIYRRGNSKSSEITIELHDGDRAKILHLPDLYGQLLMERVAKTCTLDFMNFCDRVAPTRR